MKLRWKLSLAYLFAVLAVVVSVAFAVRSTAVDAVHSHMDGGMAGMMGGVNRNLEGAVEAGVNQALTTGLIMAGLVGLFASVAISIWVTRPLGKMAEVAGRIAEGDYSPRVQYAAGDEIGEFSRAFNDMASKLEATEQVRRDLLATISHELRTPLSSIQGYMEGLIDGVLPAEPETLQLVRRESERLGRLVADIERISRLEAGAELIQPRVSPARELVWQATAAMRPLFEEKGVELMVSAPDDINAFVDPDKTLQVLTNLLQNALRYTAGGGHVMVAVTPQNGELLFSVSDSGIGISPADLPHIFERFYRVDRSRSTAGGGAGIGLAVVKALVEQMRGRVWAESVLGLGSQFFFIVPRAAEEPAASVRGCLAEETSPTPGGRGQRSIGDPRTFSVREPTSLLSRR